MVIARGAMGGFEIGRQRAIGIASIALLRPIQTAAIEKLTGTAFWSRRTFISWVVRFPLLVIRPRCSHDNARSSPVPLRLYTNIYGTSRNRGRGRGKSVTKLGVRGIDRPPPFFCFFCPRDNHWALLRTILFRKLMLPILRLAIHRRPSADRAGCRWTHSGAKLAGADFPLPFLFGRPGLPAMKFENSAGLLRRALS